MIIKLLNRDIELENERIVGNDITFPHEFNPHNVRLWAIGNEFGPIGAVWADCEQNAFDALVDNDLADGLSTDEENEDTTYLGNAGEPFDLTYAWIEAVNLTKQSMEFIVKLAECRGGCYDSLDF